MLFMNRRTISALAEQSGRQSTEELQTSFSTYRTFRSYLKESYTDIVDVARQTQRDVDLPVRLQKIPQYCDIAAATL